MAYAPACRLEDLGDPTFCADHRIRYPYLAGAMANGIGSADIVEAMGKAGMLAFFGAAGLPLPTVEAAIDRIQKNLGDIPYGFNLIHSPSEPSLERGVVDLYLRRGVRLVEASAFLDLTLPVVRYRIARHSPRSGRQNRHAQPRHRQSIARRGRLEVSGPAAGAHAARVDPPGPSDAGASRPRRAHPRRPGRDGRGRLRRPHRQSPRHHAGADPGRPARSACRHSTAYDEPLRVGAAGGIATPASAAAAFAMGAAYVLTGSVNQACVESGSSDPVREMLAQAEQADTIMAPAADMFEMGVKVQVLKRGTMFAMRAAKLYELYRTYPSLEALPDAERTFIEKNLFRAPLTKSGTRRGPSFSSAIRHRCRVPRAMRNIKWRWFFAGIWACRRAGPTSANRRASSIIRCGAVPAMGAFNEWTKGCFLEQPRNRRVVTVAFNILYGAAVLLRLQTLRSQAFPLLRDWSRVRPWNWKRSRHLFEPQRSQRTQRKPERMRQRE